MVVVCDADTLGLRHLPDPLTQAARKPPAAAIYFPANICYALPSMARAERSPIPQPELSQAAVDLARRFVVRRDLHARQLNDGRYICVHKPFHLGLLLAHLSGEITLGTYLLDQKSQARFIVFDADDEPKFSTLVCLAQTLATENVPGYLEKSRRGGHLWLFFARSIPGKLARDFGRGILSVHKLEGVELFPKQSGLSGGPGSLIRMPFGVHRLSGESYPFIVASGEPLAASLREQIRLLSFPQTVREAEFDYYRSCMPLEPIRADLEESQHSKSTLSERIKGSVTVLEFISQYVDLKPTNSGAIGLCPFHNDHKPSLGINDRGNYWHCFAGCGGGTVIDFWMKWRGCDFTAAVTELAKLLL